MVWSSSGNAFTTACKSLAEGWTKCLKECFQVQPRTKPLIYVCWMGHDGFNGETKGHDVSRMACHACASVAIKRAPANLKALISTYVGRPNNSAASLPIVLTFETAVYAQKHVWHNVQKVQTLSYLLANNTEGVQIFLASMIVYCTSSKSALFHFNR